MKKNLMKFILLTIALSCLYKYEKQIDLISKNVSTKTYLNVVGKRVAIDPIGGETNDSTSAPFIPARLS